MGWLYVPEAEDSSSGSGLPADTSASDIEPWVTSSGKPLQRPLSWRGWGSRAWIALLFGTISRPSMAVRSVASWISYLRDIHASRSHSRESEKGKRTSGTSGPKSSESFARYDRASRSLKTCQDTFGWDSTESSPTLPKQGSMRSGELSARLASALRTSARGSSAWHTPKTNDGGTYNGPRSKDAPITTSGLGYQGKVWPTPTDSMMTPEDMEQARFAGNSSKRPDYRAAAKNWPTPKTPTGGPNPKDPGQPGPDLQAVAVQSPPGGSRWRSPSGRDWKGESAASGRERKKGEGDQTPTLVDQVIGPPAPESGRSGDGSSRPTPDSSRHWQTPRVGPKGTPGEGARHGGQPKGRKLNPRFVEWLMGWPDGWSNPLSHIDRTGFDSWEMESCRLLRRLLS